MLQVIVEVQLANVRTTVNAEERDQKCVDKPVGGKDIAT